MAAIEDCLGCLNRMLSGANDLILRIQQLQAERKAIYISKMYDEQHKLSEFWMLSPDTITVVHNTENNRSTEITIKGSGFHGKMNSQWQTRPMEAGWAWIAGDPNTAADWWNNVIFIEMGTHTLNVRAEQGCPLTAKNIIGVGTPMFGDDADYMYEVVADQSGEDTVDSAIRALGYYGFYTVANATLNN